MMNTWKANLEETKQHYIDWWDHKGIVLNMWEHFQQGVTPHADIPAPKPYKDLNQRWFDPEWRAEYLDWYVAHSSLKADILPVANTQLGPGSLAAILGGVFEGGEDTIWIHPRPVVDSLDVDEITFDPNHPNWLLHKELLKACKAKAQGHYYVGMPDLMEGLDVLAAIKGTDKVLLDTVMQPEVLEHQMQQINDIYFQVFDELYDIIREGDEMAFCYFSSWAPGKMSKLQSDISTMISVDDYRRFVQPFIREQCQKIEYTLYHLDGVGAMHHLDALLEIDELNAIQWTPGVGEPQGGSPKWYDLYRKILAGGKSIMACWVTLDELRPLLDNIGGEGVHIEMDFHNEHEVDQALTIVDDFRHARNLHPATSASGFADADAEVAAIIRRVEAAVAAASPATPTLPADRILILDGAMGTMLQQYHTDEACNDMLCLTSPDIVRTVHRKYLDAGADIIETNTFNAQRISLSDYGLEDRVRDINLAAARIAHQCADEFSSSEKPRFVAGSIGPTSRTTSIATSGEPLAESDLRTAYTEQIEALRDGGVDLLLIETIFDINNARIALDVASTVAPNLPVMLSFSVAIPDGHNMLGQDIVDFLAHISKDGIFSVGINCVSDVPAMTPLVRRLAQFGTHVSLYPNAGMPDAQGRYSKTPESLVVDLWPLIEGHHLNILGGCCGTTDAHIALMARAIQPMPGLYISPLTPGIAAPAATVPSSSPLGPVPGSSDKTAEDNASRLFTAILNGKSDDAATATREAIADGAIPQDLINGQMIRAMSEVGQQFQDGKAFVPQLLMAGRAMKTALELLKPMMAGTAATSLGKVVIGTVKGDLHDIGKNLVASMLEGCGFEVVNIGIDVSADKFIEAVKENQPDILCMSALLTTTMGYMKEVIDALEKAGIRQQVKVMVGGAPVTQGFADEIGADGYSDNANSAVTVAKQLLRQR
jgi:corrinoid protein of di/trimethylamine methyltransferase